MKFIKEEINYDFISDQIT